MAFRRKFSAKRRAHPRHKRPVRRSYASHRKRGGFAKKVMKVMAKTLADKSVQYESTYLVAPADSAGWLMTTVNCVPNATTLSISQGVGAGDRIGNVLKMKKCDFKAFLYNNPENASTNASTVPWEVRILVLRNKQDGQNGVQPTDLFQNGDSSTGPSGYLTDMVSEINRDKYSVYYDKRRKLGFASYTGAATVGTMQFYANNDFKLNQYVHIDLMKHGEPKTVKYNDTTASSTSPYLYVVVLIAGADGLLHGDTAPVSFQFQMDLHWTE
jgi:hypothetical protein